MGLFTNRTFALHGATVRAVSDTRQCEDKRIVSSTLLTLNMCVCVWVCTSRCLYVSALSHVDQHIVWASCVLKCPFWEFLAFMSCVLVCVFLLVMELLLLLLHTVSCFQAYQKLRKCLGDSGSDAIQHPFNYGSHRAGNARLMGGIRSCTVARRCSFGVIHLPR